MSTTSESSSSLSSPRILSRASSRTSLTSYSHGREDLIKISSDKVNVSHLHSLHSSSTQTRSICFVGAGYVGGPTAAVIAYCNPNIAVTVVDKNKSRIQRWQSKHLPIHEPGLVDIVRIARDGANGIDLDGPTTSPNRTLPQREPNLFFSTDCDEHIASADIVFLSVNTPTKMAGIGAGAATDISSFEAAARAVAQVAKPGCVVVEKSTVPCRTAQVVRDILTFYRPGVPFEVLSNPEFLAEGTAIPDLLNPSRVLIGSSRTPSGHAAAAKLAQVYASWVPQSSVVTVGLWSAELSKLVANAMLAQRISSINTISAICEKTGADVDDVAVAVGKDVRLGPKFLKAGLGFGGSCFKKDVLSLSYLAESFDLYDVAQYWRSVVQINEWQCQRFVKKVVKRLNGSLRGKKITLLGYAFKKDTSDTRESQATRVVEQLLQEAAAEIAIFDPQCNKKDVEDELTFTFATGPSSSVLKPQGAVCVYTNPYEACANASAVLILTEWKQFSYPPCPERPGMLESDTLSTRAIRPGMNLRQTSQMNVLERRAVVQDHLSRLQDTHPQVRSDPQDDRFCRFRPEPPCKAECPDCEFERDQASHAKENLDWNKVASLMRGERWLFDGRGMVDVTALEALGFRCEAIGRAPSRAVFDS